MTDRSALVRAVLEHPEDDDLRLVYADALEDAGRPDADFVRLQVKCACAKSRRRKEEFMFAAFALLVQKMKWLPSAPGNPPWRAELCPPREHPGDSWLERLRIVCGSWLEYRRGFVDRVSLGLEGFLAQAEALFSQHPITGVRLWDRSPYLSRPGRWMWAEAAAPKGPHDSWRLPGGLYARLARPAGAACASAGEAQAALSRACVNYGRTLAGLPELTESR
jgi:uncharacterized protein (TIGR02996 family)